MTHDERILITGASGFIGGWLAETLYLADVAEVRAGIHKWSSAARLARFPLTIVPCDILDTKQVAQAMEGINYVIHCAKGPYESIVEETGNVLAAALRERVRRFIHISTAEVYGNQSGEIDEASPYQYTSSRYANAKIDAERICWEFHDRGLPVTVIRPSIVYGPFSKTWTVDIARKLRSGNWGIFEGHGDGICNLVYVGDLVSAILMAARHEEAIGKAFNVNGPDRLTWNQYFKKFNAALSLPELRTFRPGGAGFRATIMEPLRTSAKLARDHFETPMKKLAARYRLAKQIMKAFEHTMKTMPRATDFRLYERQAVYPATKAHEVLGFTPKFDVDMGLEMSIHWLEQVGLLDK